MSLSIVDCVERKECKDFRGYLEDAEDDVGLASFLCFFWAYYTGIFKLYPLSVIQLNWLSICTP